MQEGYEQKRGLLTNGLDEIEILRKSLTSKQLAPLNFSAFGHGSYQKNQKLISEIVTTCVNSPFAMQY